MSNKDLKNELDDKANWPKPIEEHFIHLLYEEAKKACKPISEAHFSYLISGWHLKKFGNHISRTSLQAVFIANDDLIMICLV
ncbi:hypothetical protein L3X38_001815 [Prunus dulcis]|uniref:Uncharacterized protein n=1 Tax=Prunus dulcis TaxID=3755 RepID=A0AAD4WT92_PRUDU|nr:hypothetical protein L3X38_001815 [Prunus dulcis]